MKRLAMLTVLALMPASMVFAQGTLDDEINAELDRMYTTQSRNQAPSVQVNVQSNPNAVASPYNNQVSGQTQDQRSQSTSETSTRTSAESDTRIIQKQPTTIIESTSITDTRAERLRRARQDAELETENNLVIKIEASRLEDERRRSEMLFGDKFNQMMNNRQQSQQDSRQDSRQDLDQNQGQSQGTKQVIVNKNYGTQGDVNLSGEQQAKQEAQQVSKEEIKQEAAQISAPTLVQLPEEKVEEKRESSVIVIVKDERKDEDRDHEHNHGGGVVSAPIEMMKPVQETERRGYVSGLVGMADYPDVLNVRGNYSFGLAMGTKVDDRLLFEGSFLYSNFSIEQADSGPMGFDPVYGRITNMDQFAFNAAVKYQLFGGTIRPVVGGVMGYAYRTFSDVQLGFANNDASSHAFDVGVMGGLDIEVSRNFTLGLDTRYMWNVFNRSSSAGFQRRFSQQVTGSDTPIEELSYMTFSVVGRATF